MRESLSTTPDRDGVSTPRMSASMTSPNRHGLRLYDILPTRFGPLFDIAPGSR
jgi:hypothetical protein